ncbi:MAG TPA: hypothetical protein VHZ78_08810 [Rhizomicrobium sp.]|jgi:hypothetical protein|nr:hypothetical protein [Rhizomicrobium sp.]
MSARKPTQAWLWTTDAIAGAVTLGIIYAVICCLPLIAPYGIVDRFSTP